MEKQTQAAFDFLCSRNPLDIEQSTYVFLLMDFIAIQGEAALQGLAGFYIWTIENIEGEDQEGLIASTFAHDLGGMREKFMLPRSDDYKQFWEDEFKKTYMEVTPS